MIPTRHDNGPWRWISGSLFAVVLLLLGAAGGHIYGQYQAAAISQELKDHALQAGHPILVERMAGMKEQLDRIEGMVRTIKDQQP